MRFTRRFAPCFVNRLQVLFSRKGQIAVQSHTAITSIVVAFSHESKKSVIARRAKGSAWQSKCAHPSLREFASANSWQSTKVKKIDYFGNSCESPRNDEKGGGLLRAKALAMTRFLVVLDCIARIYDLPSQQQYRFA